MSYIRAMEGGLGLYIYPTTLRNGTGAIECWCSVGEHQFYTTLEQWEAHVEAHRAAGRPIPEDVLAEIRADFAAGNYGLGLSRGD